VFPLLLLALLAVAFVAFARTTTGMVTGQASADEPVGSPYGGRAVRLAAAAPLGVGLVALLVLGLWIPAGLDTVIRHCVAVMS
jgi:hypothetical protein